MIRNVHERRLELPPVEIGLLIDRLAGDDDRLWPSDRWPPMRFDRGLAVGARGGHGPVRYEVVAHEPGRLAAFRFAPGVGLEGTHRFEREGTTLRHVLEARTRGSGRLSWPLAFRWLHDACVEDALDRAAGAPPRPHSVGVRLLRRLLRARVRRRAGYGRAS